VRLALDWDGTCTVSDSLVDAIGLFGDEGVYRQVFSSYGESLAAEVGTIRASAEDVSAWAAGHVRVSPGLHDLADRFQPVIVSSGLPQLILPVLEREGLDLEVRCNDAQPLTEGWRLAFRDEGPCAVCGDMCKRRSLPAGRPLVYAGDGVSDLCAARAADRVFACGWLAEALERDGLAYEPFDTLADVAAALP
jgi:2-hydroxy-3-keto-5-methylthiopentenyl-1-phosphate phosphatase